MRARLIVATACVAGLLLVANAQDGPQAGRTGLGMVAAKMLRDDDRSVSWQERQELLRELNEHYGAVREQVLSVLSLEREAPRALPYGAQLHTAMLAARSWRVSEAKPQLRRMIGCRLDPATVPVGKKMQAADFYPAAQCLASLPVRVEDLLVGVTDEELPIVSWVLAESQGREGAVALLKGCAADARFDGKRVGKAVELLQATKRTHELLPPLGK